MYYYIPVNGLVEKLDDKAAAQKMTAISQQWEDESSPMGKVFLGVFNWDYRESEKGVEILIPNLYGGGSVPANNIAQKLIGGAIYGDCFLKPKDSDIPNIDKRLASIR